MSSYTEIFKFKFEQIPIGRRKIVNAIKLLVLMLYIT